jgi:hypothetical protein
MPRFTRPSDDSEEMPTAAAVNAALLMDNDEIDFRFRDIRYREYAMTEEVDAEFDQKQAALAQLKYMRWLASTPTAAEIAAAQRALTSSAIE